MNHPQISGALIPSQIKLPVRLGHLRKSAKSADLSPDIVSAADRFVKLWRIYSAFKAIEPEFEELKRLFREVAGNRNMGFPCADNSAAVVVEQKPDAVCRVVTTDDLVPVVKYSGDHVFDLFTLHPSRGNERNFELNALKLLPKRDASSLLARLTRPCTSIVRLLAG